MRSIIFIIFLCGELAASGQDSFRFRIVPSTRFGYRPLGSVALNFPIKDRFEPYIGMEQNRYDRKGLQVGIRNLFRPEKRLQPYFGFSYSRTFDGSDNYFNGDGETSSLESAVSIYRVEKNHFYTPFVGLKLSERNEVPLKANWYFQQISIGIELNYRIADVEKVAKLTNGVKNDKVKSRVNSSMSGGIGFGLVLTTYIGMKK